MRCGGPSRAWRSGQSEGEVAFDAERRGRSGPETEVRINRAGSHRGWGGGASGVTPRSGLAGVC